MRPSKIVASVGGLELRPPAMTKNSQASERATRYWRRNGAVLRSLDEVALSKVCSARARRAYRIKSTVRAGGLELFFIDVETGEPPKTPCGPDEDDD
jgi:hypothetical protein